MKGFSFCIRPKFHKRHFLPIFTLGTVGRRSLYIMVLIRRAIGIVAENRKEPHVRLRDV